MSPLATRVGVCAAVVLTACSTPSKLSTAQLESIGVRPGSPHWQATRSLHQAGYLCSVSGKKREQFDCTKTVGFLPTCVLRVGFEVNDANEIVALSVPEPACMGPP